MPGRRLIILLVLLLISLSVLSASRDVSRTRLPGTTSTTTTSTKTQPKPEPSKASEPKAAERPARTVDLSLPNAGARKVPLGSRVIIQVKSSKPEIAAVESLGVRSPVGPGTTGRLDFIASSAGRFPVTLAISGRRIGEIVVRG